MLLDYFLDLGFLEIGKLILLDVEDNPGTTPNAGCFGIMPDGKASTSTRLPDVLLIIIRLGDNLNLIGNQVCRIETNTELT